MNTPSLDSFMRMPRSEIASRIAPRRISLLVTLDGTRRWAFLHHPESRRDFALYSRLLAEATISLIDRVFALGVREIVIPALYPPNFERGDDWLRAALGPHGTQLLFNEPYLAAYARWNARSRIGGTFPRAQAWAVAELAEVNRRLVAATPDGERLVVWSCDAGEVLEAMLEAAQEAGTDKRAAHRRYYPDGPEQVHLIIQGGWPRVLSALPTLTSRAHLYFVTNLTLDLTEAQLRAVLYDYAFQREIAPEDNMAYSDELLAASRRIYLDEAPRVAGLGVLGPEGIWVLRDGSVPDAWLAPREELP